MSQSVSFFLTVVVLGFLCACSEPAGQPNSNGGEELPVNDGEEELPTNDLTPDADGNIYARMESGGNNRTYIIHVPNGYEQGESLPLVFNLHGFSVTGEIQMNYTQFNTTADEHKFFAVYPDGLRRFVNGQNATHWDSQHGTGTEDVLFIDNLIDRMYTDFDIDLSKVYATGFSNGGAMSYRLGCELSDRVAAIAPVSGILPNAQINNCELTHPIPVVHLHGSEDQGVPLTGLAGFSLSVAESIDYFVDKLACDAEAEEFAIPDRDPNDQSTARYFVYTSCDNASEVRYYEGIGANHTWPDALESAELGITNRDFNGNQVIWEFFERFEHPSPRRGTLLD